MRKSFIGIATTFFGIVLIAFLIFHFAFIHIFAASPVTVDPVDTIVVTETVNPQMMNIACHECGEVITVDISQPEATCTHCGECNHFSG
ncbi:hypothetical protein [Butyrivibrio sp. NC2007]|uniref:hypothetical protein n=1 Tax=Butyrivibrio sp. NC2007 TaxID=1280683 RepID=UPI0003B46714|nr:hypothetical protein [Butyrivibrio sp. NC2007]